MPIDGFLLLIITMTFEAIENLSEAQIEDLYQIYQSQWWSKERQKSDIDRMLEHSDVIVAFCDPNSKRLVAFARILTDYVYRALIFDVMVETSYQGRGLGRMLMEAIVDRPELKSVEALILCCLPEMQEFYEKWGFMEKEKNLLLLIRGQI